MRGLALLMTLGAVQLAAPAHAEDVRLDPTKVVEAATPPGVLLEEALPPRSGARIETAKSRWYLLDASSRMLYTYEADTNGKSTCDDACTKAWPPLIATGTAIPSPEWSIVARADGTKQWAYKGKPLYRSVMDTAPGQVKGKAFSSKGLRGTTNFKAPHELEDEATAQWQPAVFDRFKEDRPMPAAITQAQRLGSVDAPAFADSMGMTLYFRTSGLACDAKCRQTWKPMTAARLALPVGDWTLVKVEDGTRQWAYKGQPVYTYAHDNKPGDTNGAGAGWSIALVNAYDAPATVKVTKNAKNWSMFTDANGKTLYALEMYNYFIGTHHLNPALFSQPITGRMLAEYCKDSCTESWRPYVAAADAEGSGFWSIVTRSDGTRQWAYQGYPLYTFAEDHEAGDMNGHDSWTPTDGQNAVFWRVAIP